MKTSWCTADYINTLGWFCIYIYHLAITRTMITEVDSLLATPCYLTCTMISNTYYDTRGMLSAHHTLLPNMYHDNRGSLSAHHALPPNMYHGDRVRLSTYQALLPNMYHDNRGRLSAHHTLLPKMYHDNRGRHTGHHTLQPNICLYNTWLLNIHLKQ